MLCLQYPKDTFVWAVAGGLKGPGCPFHPLPATPIALPVNESQAVVGENAPNWAVSSWGEAIWDGAVPPFHTAHVSRQWQECASWQAASPQGRAAQCEAAAASSTGHPPSWLLSWQQHAGVHLSKACALGGCLGHFYMCAGPGHSTHSNLTSILAMVTLTYDLSRQLGWGKLALLLLLLELTAVFNMVDYGLLTHCFTEVEIRGAVLQWLTSFFHGWGWRIVLEEDMSMRHSLMYRMPQGMILSWRYLISTCAF